MEKTARLAIVLIIMGFIGMIGFERYMSHREKMESLVFMDCREKQEMVQRMDSLEKRIKTFETLYRAHLEECAFISVWDIEIGYDNYLRLRKDDGTIRNR